MLSTFDQSFQEKQKKKPRRQEKVFDWLGYLAGKPLERRDCVGVLLIIVQLSIERMDSSATLLADQKSSSSDISFSSEESGGPASATSVIIESVSLAG